jgi:hypothetical protein
LPLVRFEELARANVPGEVGILNYRCPADLSGPFLSLGVAHQHRELFQAAPEGVRPVHGTTWLANDFCLASVNRGNFWVQSRPLVAYWGGAERPARSLQARVLKDDYDFASALLYSVQEEGYVIGVVTFRHPGGDKHPSLDPVVDGQFRCSRLRLRFDLAGVPGNAPILVNREAADLGEYPPGGTVSVDVGGTWFWLHSLGARCGDPAGRLSLEREDGLLTISIDFLNGREPRTIRWPQTAYSAFLLAMREPGERGDHTLDAFDRQLMSYPMELRDNGSHVRLEWNTPAGLLELESGVRAAGITEMDRAFRERLKDAPVPIVRLSDEKLV